MSVKSKMKKVAEKAKSLKSELAKAKKALAKAEKKYEGKIRKLEQKISGLKTTKTAKKKVNDLITEPVIAPMDGATSESVSVEENA